MTNADASQGAAADNPGNSAEWAKTVADGAASASAPPAAPLGNVTPDEILDADAGNNVADPSAEGEVSAETETPLDDNADVAEVVDAEIVEDDESGGESGDGAETAAGKPATEDHAATDGSGEDAVTVTVEDLVLDLERVTTERDQYLDASRRLQAEFENYKKQVGKREATARERANDSLISELLPVMDAFDGAVANGAEDVAPMRSSFLDALAKQGLERIDPLDDAFDPNLHEAVLHEDAADVDGPVVAEVMRAGYAWKGRVLRPAMVRTRG